MTEHDAETVARATLWLDTSNETTTRRAERRDECPTLAFQRIPALEPATSFLHAARPAETATLDRSGILAAFDGLATATLDRAPLHWAGAPVSRTRAAWRGVATHALALALGAAAGSTMLSSRVERPRATAPAAPAQRAAAPNSTEPPNAPRHAATDLPAAEPSATLSGAVDALARGDYATAHASYAALAGVRPNDAALASVAAILASRLTARCADTERTEGRCNRE